jgi:DNA-binding IclR family transcriptional regulator
MSNGRLKMKESNGNQVKVVLKAFSIIEELDIMGELSIGDLSKRLSMDKATVHRLLNTIKGAGYVYQNQENRKYANSTKMFTIGKKAVDNLGIKDVAEMHIKNLANMTKETINLGIRIDDRIVYIDKIESQSTIKVSIDIGTTIPCYCTGMGKAVLAYLSEEEVDDILADEIFQSYTRNTPTSMEELKKQLVEVRKNGFSMDNEEFLEELISFGAPIFDYHGRPVAAISISFPKYRYNPKEHYHLYSKMVTEAACNISSKLGHDNL